VAVPSPTSLGASAAASGPASVGTADEPEGLEPRAGSAA
jgi:hypothetical protein